MQTHLIHENNKKTSSHCVYYHIWSEMSHQNIIYCESGYSVFLYASFNMQIVQSSLPQRAVGHYKDSRGSTEIPPTYSYKLHVFVNIQKHTKT